MTNSNTNYSVSIWETIGITLGAIALVLAASVRLGWKYSSDTLRSEIIARSLIDYQIPGGSQGVFGINIGAGKFAIVSSVKNVPDTNTPELQIIVSKVPTTQAENIDSNIFSNNQFEVESSTTVKQEFCGQSSNLLIEKGQQTLLDGVSKSPATQYTLKAVVGNHERQVIITALGQDSEQKAKSVLWTLKCIIKKY